MLLELTKPDFPFVSAGFPSPAGDFTDLSISLDRQLIKNPSATFMVYAHGDSMINVGIHHGDILIVDRSASTMNGDIIIALLDGEFLVKEYFDKNGDIKLVPHNPEYSPIKISKEMDFQVWGVVIHSIRSFK